MKFNLSFLIKNIPVLNYMDCPLLAKWWGFVCVIIMISSCLYSAEFTRAKDANREQNTLSTYDPDNGDYYIHLGKNLIKSKKYTEAIDALKSGVGILPDHAEAHYLLGSAYFKIGEKDLAQGVSAILSHMDTNACEKLQTEINEKKPYFNRVVEEIYKLTSESIMTRKIVNENIAKQLKNKNRCEENNMEDKLKLINLHLKNMREQRRTDVEIVLGHVINVWFTERANYFLQQTIKIENEMKAMKIDFDKKVDYLSEPEINKIMKKIEVMAEKADAIHEKINDYMKTAESGQDRLDQLQNRFDKLQNEEENLIKELNSN